MNYRFKYLGVLFILFTISLGSAYSQNEGSRPVVVKNRTNIPNIRNNSQSNKENTGISNRLSSFMKIKANDIENASWKRILIRKVNIDDIQNEALEYTSENCKKNLFAIIFDLFVNNKINCYEYIDAIELFDDKHRIEAKDIIEKFQINNRIEGNRYIVEDVDVPSKDVKSYYFKEVYYFDQNTSEFKREVIALCPVVTMLNDYGEEMRIPMFWVVYEDLRPFISNEYVSISDLNMVENYSLSDFIDMNMYKGDIVRVGNKSVNKMASSQDSIDIVQKRIEKQLSDITSSVVNKSTEPDSIKQVEGIIKNEKTKKKNSRDKKLYKESKNVKETKSSRIVKSVRR